MSARARTIRGRKAGLAAAIVALGGLAGAALAGDGQIVTVVGGGLARPGDGMAATAVRLDQPRGLALEPDGSLLIAEFTGQRVRRVATDGTIATVAGTGVAGYAGDGGPASAAQLDEPTDVALAPSGPYQGILIADELNHVVRRVDPAGVITTVAGIGAPGGGGDHGPATAAGLRNPRGLATTPDGGFLIADEYNNRIRRVGPDGIITTVAGTGAVGASGDGGPAAAARLNRPLAVASLGGSDFLIADGYNNCVRAVSGGVIRTAAGQCGGGGYAGDGGPSTAALLLHPRDILPVAGGCFYIADSDNQRIRQVSPAGVISTVAGSGAAGFAGDAGPPAAAAMTQPSNLALDPAGALLIADTGNGRVRRAVLATPAASAPPPPAGAVENSAPPAAGPPPEAPRLVGASIPAGRPPRVILTAPERARAGRVLRVRVRTDRAVVGAAIALQARVRGRFVTAAHGVLRGRSATLPLHTGTRARQLAIRVVLRLGGVVATSATHRMAVVRGPRCATAAPGHQVRAAC